MENQELSMAELALIALASGTHRLQINEDGVELVERESPQPEVMYSQVKKPQIMGKAWVHETPLSLSGMGNIEIECFMDDSFETSFRATVTIPRLNGERLRVPLFSKKDIENGK